MCSFLNGQLLWKGQFPGAAPFFQGLQLNDGLWHRVRVIETNASFMTADADLGVINTITHPESTHASAVSVINSRELVPLFPRWLLVHQEALRFVAFHVAKGEHKRRTQASANFISDLSILF